MKIVVIGGHGLLGSKVVERLRLAGHDAFAASRRSGVDVLTGQGLPKALAGASVVIDASNAPSFDEPEVSAFFRRGTENLLAACHAAGVDHFMALSVVGASALKASAYFRAKQVQESLVVRSDVPFTLVLATQFFEFIARIIPPGSPKRSVRLSPALVQPVAADDVADIIVERSMRGAVRDVIEVGGPESHRLSEIVQWVMYSYQDDRPVVADPAAPYYGARLDDRVLRPGANAILGPTGFREWLDGYLTGAMQFPVVHHPDPLERATPVPAFV